MPQTIFITGGAKRIGKAIAMDFASPGNKVVIHYHRSGIEARRLQKMLNKKGAEVFLLQADFSKAPVQPAVKRVVRELWRKVGAVDIFINNASIFYPIPLEKMTEKHWDLFHTVNLKTPFFLAAELGLLMKKRKTGKIINITDWTVFQPPAGYLPYVIAKAGLHTATVGLARALAPYVQVNSIAPGPILESRGMTAQQKKAVVQKTLLKRFGNPKDVVAAVRFLVSGTDFITGAMIPIDGGSLAGTGSSYV